MVKKRRVRMKRLTLSCLCILLIAIFATGAMAADAIAEADRLFDQGGLENYKQAIDLYINAVNANPKSYEATWKCARAHREYGDEAKKQNIESWKDICVDTITTGSVSGFILMVSVCLRP
jgi:hypothetical protein